MYLHLLFVYITYIILLTMDVLVLKKSFNKCITTFKTSIFQRLSCLALILFPNIKIVYYNRMWVYLILCSSLEIWEIESKA